MNITHDEWMAALHEAAGTDPNPDALTISDLMGMLGLGRSAMNIHIRKLVESGKAQKVMKTIKGTDGRRQVVPAYILVKKGKA